MSNMQQPTDTQAVLGAGLEGPLVEVETCLNDLGEALLKRDSVAIEQQAGRLHQALARAVVSFREAAQQGKLPAQLRHRLVLAGGKMAAQRASLTRASAALDRAIDVLMPAEPAGLYGSGGMAERSVSRGSIQA